MIYNQEQWNTLVQSMRAQNQNSIQEVMLPLNNIQQKNPIYISNDSIYRLDQAITDSIPQNIQWNFSNKGFFNNYNSNLSFNIPIHITGLPQYDTDLKHFTYKIARMSTEDPQQFDLYDGNNNRITYQIVLYNNYICLLTHFDGQRTDGSEYWTSDDYLVRLYKIPPSPQSYLDTVLIQKNNHSNNAFNDMYKDIFRKISISNQIIEQDFSDFLQQQYAYVSHNQDITIPDQRRPFTVNNDKIKILAEYTSTASNPITEITYNYQVSIPLVYFHPFFQMAYNTPMELLNEEISMIMNFNLPIFSACYAYQKNGRGDFNDMITVALEGINDMKIILYKDALMNYKTIEQSKNGIYYLIYRNSDYAQYQAFSKYDTITLQNVVPKLNSLDIIQLSLFDKKQYVIGPGNKTKQINNMDFYLGYSSLFNEQAYQNYYGKVWQNQTIKDGDGVNQSIFNLYDADYVGLNTNFRLQKNQADAQVFMCSLGDIQLSLDNRAIIPYSYQKLEDVYKTNISLYDIADNKFAPNAHWDYPYYLKYFNTYIYKFDQKYGQKQQLQQPQFKGLTVSDAKSNIFCKLYNYNTGENPPVPVQYRDFDPTTSPQGFYNNTNMLDDSKAWIDTELFCEFIYYYSSLYMIAGGDLIQISEQETANILKNVPFYNETDYKVAQAIPLFIKLAKDDLQNEIMSNILAKIREGNLSLQVAKDESTGQISDAQQQMINQNVGGETTIPTGSGEIPAQGMGEGTGLQK